MIFFILQEGSEIKEVYFCLKANFNVSIVSLMDPKIVIEIPEEFSWQTRVWMYYAASVMDLKYTISVWTQLLEVLFYMWYFSVNKEQSEPRHQEPLKGIFEKRGE